MSKFTCLVLFVVAASLTSLHVTKAQSLRESLRPVIVACSQGPESAITIVVQWPITDCMMVDFDKFYAFILGAQEHGVTDADIQAAKDAGSAAGIKPCFIGCVFKKAGFINDKGEYDLETGLKNLRQFVKDDEQYKKLAEVAKQCLSVKDKAVSDGTAGCEKGVLLAGCFLEHKTSIII